MSYRLIRRNKRYDSRVPTTCNYPGCTQPIPRPSGPGRPSEYCDRPEHTRWRAWRERQRLQQEADPQPDSVTVTQTGPVTAARLRAEELLPQFRNLAEQLGTTLNAAVTEMSTLADPSAAEAQVQAVQADAARRIAEAEMAAAAAEQARRDAQQARIRAEEAAEDAAATADTAEARIAEARSQTAAAETARDDALHEVEAVTTRAADDVFAARCAAEEDIRAARNEAGAEIERIRAECAAEIERARRAADACADACDRCRSRHHWQSWIGSLRPPAAVLLQRHLPRRKHLPRRLRLQALPQSQGQRTRSPDALKAHPWQWRNAGVPDCRRSQPRS